MYTNDFDSLIQRRIARNDRIKIALDTALIFYLAKVTAPKQDTTSKFIKDFINGKVSVDKYEFAENRPEFLNDGWLGSIAKDEKGQRYYKNLHTLSLLLRTYQKGLIEFCILPSIAKEVVNNSSTIDFVDNYCTILNEPESESFKIRKGELVSQYLYLDIFASKDKLVNQYLNSITSKGNETEALKLATKVAEATIYGIYFVVKNSGAYIHFEVKEQDFGRLNMIRNTNKRLGYIYTKENGEGFTVEPKLVTEMSAELRHITHNPKLTFHPHQDQVGKYGNYISRD